MIQLKYDAFCRNDVFDFQSVIIYHYMLLGSYLMQEGSTSGTTLLFTVFLGSMTLGTVLMAFLRKRDGEKTEEEGDSSLGFYTLLASLWNQLITPLCDMRLLLIVPLIAFSGLQQAFVW